MKIIDHGNWKSYTPGKHPKGFLSNALFLRRDSDKIDWYDFVGKLPKGHYTFCTQMFGEWVVQEVVSDPTRLFPWNAKMLEIKDPEPNFEFTYRVYDLQQRSFTRRMNFEEEIKKRDATN